MKNTIKLLGTQSRLLCAIALLTVIGFSMAACNDNSASLAGTKWGRTVQVLFGGSLEQATFTLSFLDSSKWEEVIVSVTNKTGKMNGTYTFNGSTGILTQPNSNPVDSPFEVAGNKLTVNNSRTYTKQ